MYFVLGAVETSHIETSMPTEGEIVNAFNATSMTGRGVPVIARWASVPRITRDHSLFMPFYTYAVALLDADTLEHAQQTAANLKQRLDHMNDNVIGAAATNWSNVTVQPFLEARNGPLSDWISGAMANTQTSSNAPVAWGLNENPVGPTSDATHPASLGDALTPTGTIASATNLITTIAWVGGGVLLLYLAWPWLSSARSRGSRSSARQLGSGQRERSTSRMLPEPARARARRNPSGALHEVIVGNVGTVYSGHDGHRANVAYATYLRLSKSGIGRAADEPVYHMVDGDIRHEHQPE